MDKRRRQSKAFRQLNDEQFGEYRQLCLPRVLGGREYTLEKIVAWLKPHGVTSNTSSVHRDAEYFRAVAESRQRLSAASSAARDIVADLEHSDAVAGMQAATVSLFTQMSMDFLMKEKEISLDDLPKFSKFGSTLARLTASEISRYKAEVERRAQAAANKARQLADGAKGDVAEQLASLANEILGVAT